MYAVKDDTETNFNIVLYIKVIFLGMGVGLSEPYPTKRGPLTTRLANDLSRKKEICKDVPFFHGAIQFTVYCYIVIIIILSFIVHQEEENAVVVVMPRLQ